MKLSATVWKLESRSIGGWGGGYYLMDIRVRVFLIRRVEGVVVKQWNSCIAQEEKKCNTWLFIFFGECFLIKCRIGTSLLSQSIFIYRNSWFYFPFSLISPISPFVTQRYSWYGNWLRKKFIKFLGNKSLQKTLFIDFVMYFPLLTSTMHSRKKIVPC